MQDYRNLLVWQKAHRLTLAAYALSPYLKVPEAWPLRDLSCSAPRFPFRRTSPRVPVAARTLISGAFSGIPWVPQMSSSMTCSWLET